MKNAIIILALLPISLMAQQKNQVSFSASTQSSLTRHLGDYADETGGNPIHDLFGSFVIGIITEGEYFGEFENDYNWVTGKEVNSSQQINLAFRRSIKKRLSLGVNYTHADYRFTKTWLKGPQTATNESFNGILLDAEITWFKRKHFALSSGIGAGRATQKVRGYVNETRSRLLGQFTPLKASLSTDAIGIFIAPGIGSQGSQAGLFVQF